SLHAVVSQRLLPKKDGHGRAVACEVMIVTPTIKELMLDRDRVGEIRDYIAEGREQYGMQTFDQHLADLVQSGEVEFEVALAAATKPSDFELKMRTFRRRSTTSRKAVADPIAEPMTGAISLGVSSSAVTGAPPGRRAPGGGPCASPFGNPMTGAISLGVSSSAVTGAQPVVPPASAKTP